MKFKINAKKVTFFILALFLMQISALEHINRALGVINDISRCIAASIVLLCFFFRKKEKISVMTMMLLLMMGELLLSTLMNGGDLKAWFVAAASIISFGMLFEMSLSESPMYISAMMALMETLSYLHLLLVILFPNGLYEYNGYRVFWLFGQKNLALPYLLVAYVTAFFYGCSGGNVFREVGIYVAGIVSSILVHSSTSTVGLILLVALFFLVRRGVKFNIYFMLGGNLALFLIMVVYRLQISGFKYFIENVLHKTVTLTGRDVLWDMALFYIRKQPWLGYGLYASNPTGFSTFGEEWSLYAHNQYLQELFDGGLIQLGLYIILLLIICRRLNKYRNGMLAQCMIVTLFALNVMFITEGYRAKIIYLIYYYAYYAPQMESLMSGIRIPKHRVVIRNRTSPQSSGRIREDLY